MALVLSDGALIQQGAHAQLVEQAGLYRTLMSLEHLQQQIETRAVIDS